MQYIEYVYMSWSMHTHANTCGHGPSRYLADKKDLGATILLCGWIIAPVSSIPGRQPIPEPLLAWINLCIFLKQHDRLTNVRKIYTFPGPARKFSNYIYGEKFRIDMCRVSVVGYHTRL